MGIVIAVSFVFRNRYPRLSHAPEIGFIARTQNSAVPGDRRGENGRRLVVGRRVRSVDDGARTEEERREDGGDNRRSLSRHSRADHPAGRTRIDDASVARHCYYN